MRLSGNTQSTPLGLKTRDFSDIITELSAAFEIHAAYGSHLGGVHFELTGEGVTECTGGSSDLSVADLSTNYQTFCDPRLNYEQSLDVAFKIVEMLNAEKNEEGLDV